MNVILLPKADFAVHTSADGKSHHTVSITELNQLAHIKNVLKCGINDPIKIGQLGGNLGVARIAHMTDTTITLDKVTLTQPPPPHLLRHKNPSIHPCCLPNKLEYPWQSLV